MGTGSIESPDYSTGTECGHGATHIYCASTDVGEAFRFDVHLNGIDCEPVANVAGRQRNEIKVYANSDDLLKGYYGSTMLYTWEFKVDSTMLVSRKFTHIFQVPSAGFRAQGSLHTVESPSLERTVENTSKEIEHSSQASQAEGLATLPSLTGSPLLLR